MPSTLTNLDRKLFFLINGHHKPAVDTVMFWMSNEFIWIPFYLVLGGLLIYYFRKQSWVLILLLALLITGSDQLSGLIKNTVKRPRPCHNMEINSFVHTLNHCGGNYGFVSSHAVNTFALATFLSLLFVRKYEYMGWILFSWASLISYSRIYLGVHYPADVAGGALLGCALGFLFFRFFNYYTRKTSVPVIHPQKEQNE